MKKEYLLDYKGRKVIITDHVRQRARQRHMIPIEQMKTYFQHMIDGIDQSDFVQAYDNQEIFIYVRAFQRGCVVALRRDFKDQSNRDNVMIVMTMYPYGKMHPMKTDTEVIYA